MGTKNLAQEKEWLETTEKSIAVLQHSQQPVDALLKTMDSAGSVIAWQVGVVSPGFLGLLWNAKMLAEHTHLGLMTFAITFRISEIAFLLAIVCAVVLHTHFTGVAMMCSLGSLILQSVMSMLGRIKVLGQSQPGEGESAKQLLEGFETIRATIAKEFGFPWYVQASAKLHGYLAVIGYAGFAIIILAFKSY